MSDNNNNNNNNSNTNYNYNNNNINLHIYSCPDFKLHIVSVIVDNFTHSVYLSEHYTSRKYDNTPEYLNSPGR